MEIWGHSVAVLAAMASLGMASIVALSSILRAWFAHRRAQTGSIREQQLASTWTIVLQQMDRLSDDASEENMEELRRTARALPDLEFPDSFSRERRLRA
jgi:hypothetical protein